MGCFRFPVGTAEFASAPEAAMFQRSDTFGSNGFVRRIAALLFYACAGIASAQTPAYVFNCPLLPLLLQMPENSWLQANANLYSNVWTPLSLEPLDRGYPKPASKIILP